MISRICFSEKAAELKHDAAVAAHDAQEKATEVAHNVQGKKEMNKFLESTNIFFSEKAAELKHDTAVAAHDAQEKSLCNR